MAGLHSFYDCLYNNLYSSEKKIQIESECKNSLLISYTNYKCRTSMTVMLNNDFTQH